MSGGGGSGVYGIINSVKGTLYAHSIWLMLSPCVNYERRAIKLFYWIKFSRFITVHCSNCWGTVTLELIPELNKIWLLFKEVTWIEIRVLFQFIEVTITWISFYALSSTLKLFTLPKSIICHNVLENILMIEASCRNVTLFHPRNGKQWCTQPKIQPSFFIIDTSMTYLMFNPEFLFISLTFSLAWHL